MLAPRRLPYAVAGFGLAVVGAVVAAVVVGTVAAVIALIDAFVLPAK